MWGTSTAAMASGFFLHPSSLALFSSLLPARISPVPVIAWSTLPPKGAGTRYHQRTNHCAPPVFCHGIDISVRAICGRPTRASGRLPPSRSVRAAARTRACNLQRCIDAFSAITAATTHQPGGNPELFSSTGKSCKYPVLVLVLLHPSHNMNGATPQSASKATASLSNIYS
ncbi:hypothetical protein J3F83DRAFT_755333 [Trichoderma novae-zelandiae]